MKYWPAVFLLLLASCRESIEMTDTGDNYFPLKTGTFNEYRVHRVTYPIGELPRNTRATIRRLIDSSFILGPDSVFLITYSTQLSDYIWRKDSTHAAWKAGGRIFEQENGNTKLLLHEPLNGIQQWNLNSFNALQEAFCEIRDIDAALAVGSHYFNRTVTIVRHGDSTLLSRKKYRETYAQDVGLVKREIQHIRYCQSDSCIGKGIIESGWTELVTLEKSGRK